jgi:hypothetical protein
MRRIDLSRFCSPITPAMTPGVRAIMNMPVEGRSIHSQLGQARRDIDRKRFVRVGKCFFDSTRAACICTLSTPASRASANRRAVRVLLAEPMHLGLLAHGHAEELNYKS